VAWSTPPTFVSGNVLTAAQMNTYVRDNTNFLHDPPGCSISRGTNQNVTSSTSGVGVTLGTVIYDTDSMTGGTANRITPSTNGIYMFSFDGEWAANAGGSRVATIWETVGSNVVSNSQVTPLGTAAANNAAGEYVCTSAMVFGVEVWQNCGSTIALFGTTSGSNLNAGLSASLYFRAHWCGAG
jgi:hypothetical protein